MKKAPPIVGLIFILLMAGGFLFGAGYTYNWQRAGTPTQATVTSCVKQRRVYVCRGSWFVNGRVTLGTIENANPDDRGKRIDVRVMGDRAIKPGLRLPIILFVIGAAFAIGGLYSHFKEGRRAVPNLHENKNPH